VDGLLGAEDEELVRLHAGSCAACAALARVILAMREDLLALAEMDPGPAFRREVLAASAPLVARRRPLAARLRERWQGAYIGSFILLLLFGTPLSPLSSLPRRALVMLSANPVTGIREPVETAEKSVSSQVEWAWAVTSTGVRSTTRKVAGSVAGGSVNAIVRVRGGFEDLWSAVTATPPGDDAAGNAEPQGAPVRHERHADDEPDSRVPPSGGPNQGDRR
jgi:anti-sigma factor RsiW